MTLTTPVTSAIAEVNRPENIHDGCVLDLHRDIRCVVDGTAEVRLITAEGAVLHHQNPAWGVVHAAAQARAIAAITAWATIGSVWAIDALAARRGHANRIAMSVEANSSGSGCSRRTAKAASPACAF
jgi:hypothetical protein